MAADKQTNDQSNGKATNPATGGGTSGGGAGGTSGGAPGRGGRDRKGRTKRRRSRKRSPQRTKTHNQAQSQPANQATNLDQQVNLNQQLAQSTMTQPSSSSQNQSNQAGKPQASSSSSSMSTTQIGSSAGLIKSSHGFGSAADTPTTTTSTPTTTTTTTTSTSTATTTSTTPSASYGTYSRGSAMPATDRENRRAADELISQQQQPPSPPTSSSSSQVSNDYRLLLTPLFAAMTKITDHLFLTGVGGMTKENFRKNHIDFVVNITTEAPFWEDIETMRLPLEDDTNVNLLPYLDIAVDRINEAIVKRNAHVLVHCVAGVSRSATIVIAYLMKIKRMDLKTAFNFCYNLRPVIRPNNSFMLQLINYELQLFNKHSVIMANVNVDGTIINVPNFFVEEHPGLVILEVMRVRDRQRIQQQKTLTITTKTHSSHSSDDTANN